MLAMSSEALFARKEYMENQVHAVLRMKSA